MAKKKLAAIVKIQIPAGQATPAPPVGTALGPHGINIMDFCKAYNAATENQRGMVIPAEISIYEDRSFTFVTKTPPTPFLLRQAAGIEKGAAEPAHRQGRHGHQRPGAPDRRDEDARPQRHRPRGRDGPGRGHRALDGHRGRLTSIRRTTRRRSDLAAGIEALGPPREPPLKGAKHEQARQEVRATRCAATTASASTRRPRRSTS